MNPSTPHISFSSYWASPQHRHGYDMVKEVKDLGFDRLTLAPGFRFELAPGLLKAVVEGIIQVDAVYNMAPLLPGITLSDYKRYQPFSFLATRRQKWIQLTEKTIQFATEVGASTVVVQLGEVPFLFRNPVSTLRRLKEGRTSVELMQDMGYQKFLHQALSRVQRKSLKLLRRARASLYPVLGFALEKKIKIGIENKRYVTGLPLEEDMLSFFHAFNSDQHTLGYWYNTGYGKMKEQMGIFKPLDHLERMRPYLMGFCFNDVNADGRYRQPLGFGVIDFEELIPFVKSEHLLAIETSRRSKSKDIKESKDYLDELFS